MCINCLISKNSSRWCLDNRINNDDRCYKLNETFCKNYLVYEKNITNKLIKMLQAREVDTYPKPLEILDFRPNNRYISIPVRMISNIIAKNELYLLIESSIVHSTFWDGSIDNIVLQIQSELHRTVNYIGIGIITHSSLDQAITTNLFEFKHILSLTNNYTKIKEVLQRINLEIYNSSINNVKSLELIAHISLCLDEIGWNISESTHRIVALITNTIPKRMKSSIIPGLLKKYQKNCDIFMSKYLPTNNDQIDELTFQDILIKNKINLIIYTTNQSVKDYYDTLIQHHIRIMGSTYLIESNNWISHLFDNINYAFLNRFRVIAPPFDTNFEIYLNSLSGCRENGFTNDCIRDRLVRFFIRIRAKQCLPIDTYKIYNITVSGNQNYQLILHTDACYCNCLDPHDTSYDVNSSLCSYRGNLICGVCRCSNGYLGDRCTILSHVNSPIISTENNICTNSICYPYQSNCNGVNQWNIDNQPICDRYNYICDSKHTNALCLRKNCSHEIYLEQCIDQFGYICGNRGKCNCGICICEYGYEGNYCEKTNLKNCDIFDICTYNHLLFNNGNPIHHPIDLNHNFCSSIEFIENNNASLILENTCLFTYDYCIFKYTLFTYNKNKYMISIHQNTNCYLSPNEKIYIIIAIYAGAIFYVMILLFLGYINYKFV